MSTVNSLALIPTVHGMILSSPTKAGSRKLQLVSKKAFVQKLKDEGKTTSEAQRAFEDYRVETLNAFNARIGQEFATGNLRAERITADADGDLRSIALCRTSKTQKDKTAHARRLFLDSLSPAARAAVEAAEKAALKSDSKPTTDVPAIEVEVSVPAAQPA
jgi:hypothetical protein